MCVLLLKQQSLSVLLMSQTKACNITHLTVQWLAHSFYPIPVLPSPNYTSFCLSNQQCHQWTNQNAAHKLKVNIHISVPTASFAALKQWKTLHRTQMALSLSAPQHHGLMWVFSFSQTHIVFFSGGSQLHLLSIDCCWNVQKWMDQEGIKNIQKCQSCTRVCLQKVQFPLIIHCPAVIDWLQRNHSFHAGLLWLIRFNNFHLQPQIICGCISEIPVEKLESVL